MAWTSRVLMCGFLLAVSGARADDAEVQTNVKASQEARGEEAFKNALARLAAPQPAERAAAAEELGRRGVRFRKQIGDALRPLMLKDPDAMVRAASGRALGRLGIREAVPELTLALGDADAEVRAVAAAALWRMPEPGALPALLEHTRDPDAKVREWCVQALGAAKDPRAVAPLIERLKDADRGVRLAAIRGLGRLDAGEALAPLQGYLSGGASRDEEEKEEVVTAVAAIDAKERVATLLALYAIAAKDATQKKRLLNALGRVGDAQALPMLKKVSAQRPDPQGLRAPATAAYNAVLARVNAPDAGTP